MLNVDKLSTIDIASKTVFNLLSKKLKSKDLYQVLIPLKFIMVMEKSHVHKDVLDYLRSEEVIIVSQPPNSPDLSPYDFLVIQLDQTQHK